MKCPRCVDMDLLEVNKYGVLVDVCPSCGGIWLDKGELSKIIEAIRRAENSLDEEIRVISKDLTELESSILTAIKKGLTFEDWLEKVGYEKAIRMLKD